ncbi:MAG: cytochrome c biogenesis protein ResB [Aquabacterium sp.]|nr:MAG: cytochrome c biogenesis protein ResB [Aquabacterium sp.]
MRFAIALLCVICIAAIVGTVVEQRQPQIAYVNQFGPFWAEVFGKLGLHAVYGTWWFLVIMAFLVLSTSLCIARNTPKILHDLRTFKETLQLHSLKVIPHRAEGRSDETPAAATSRVEAALAAAGWRMKAQQREGGTLVAAKKGARNRIGYLLAHSAIVLICLGGLVDGDLVIRLQMWAQGLRPYVPGPQADLSSPEHRLGVGNPAFRGNLQVAEGQRNGYAVLNLTDGLLLQPLPFEIELKSFRVEFHDAGPPKRFVSEVVVHDGEQRIPATIIVNKPLIHRGIAIYQSDFSDGGSQVRLRSWLLATGTPGPEIAGTVGDSQPLPAPLSGEQPLALELDDLREINVEDLGAAEDPQQAASHPAAAASASGLARLLGAADKTDKPRNMHNVGPVLVYKLRDQANQAREFRNYMLPIELDGQRVFLLGQRNSPSEDFSYLRIPADENGSMEGWMRLRAALVDPQARALAAQRYVQRALPGTRADLAPRMVQTAERVLGLFAGAVLPRGAREGNRAPGGLAAISQDIEGGVPEGQRESTANALMPMLRGALFELVDVSREHAGLPAQKQDDAGLAFNTQALLSLSDSFFYGSPAVLAMSDFRKVQASVFQVARAPGQSVVYLGALLLAAGVFCMLFVRERRLWIWVAPHPDAGARITMALTSNRQTLEVDREFEGLVRGLVPVVQTLHTPGSTTHPQAAEAA